MKRITLLCGHYGSGKTNIAVNLALRLKPECEKLALADLDIVNPYYRSLDSRRELEQAGIRVICSEYANTNLDVPALPQEMYALTDDLSLYGIIDVGGDERGALALGRLSPKLREEDNYDMFLVVNRFRPLTPDAEAVREVQLEIEAACGLRFTGIVNNSNLGAETAAEDILSSVSYGESVSKLTGLPVVMTGVEESLYDAVKEKIPAPFPMKLQKRPV